MSLQILRLGGHGAILLKLTPTPDQAAAITTIANDLSAGAIVGAEIGAGKTLISVEGALERFPRRTLIVAPLPVYENWEKTVREQTDGLATLRACGNTKYAGIPAKELKANLNAFYGMEDGFFFMGREFWVSQDWHTVDVGGKKRRKRKGVYKKAGVDVLIFDEAHFAASKTSRGGQTFKYAPADYKIAVSGTFFGNNFENAWTLPNAIWREPVTDTFALWRAEYAATKYNHFTHDKLEVTGEREPGKWVTKLPTYIFISGHKGEVIPEEHFVDLYPSQRRVYDGIDKEFAARAESGDWVLPEIRAEALIRMRQAAIADIDVRPKPTKDNPYAVEIHFPEDGKSAKYDELLRILRDNDEPVLVTADFVGAAKRITEWLNRDGISAGLWAGKLHTKDADRMALKESFLNLKTRALVGIPAAMGTGVDGLQSVCRRLYIVSETQNGVDREQLIGRLDRKGQERPVYVTNIHSRGTIDVDITDSLAMQAIKNAEIRRKGEESK